MVTGTHKLEYFSALKWKWHIVHHHLLHFVQHLISHRNRTICKTLGGGQGRKWQSVRLKQTHQKQGGCSKSLSLPEKDLELVAVLQTSMTSALYHIFYYECSIQLNIYNWFLSDLLDVHSVKCMKKKNCMPISVCQ